MANARLEPEEQARHEALVAEGMERLTRFAEKLGAAATWSEAQFDHERRKLNVTVGDKTETRPVSDKHLRYSVEDEKVALALRMTVRHMVERIKREPEPGQREVKGKKLRHD